MDLKSALAELLLLDAEVNALKAQIKAKQIRRKACADIIQQNMQDRDPPLDVLTVQGKPDALKIYTVKTKATLNRNHILDVLKRHVNSEMATRIVEEIESTRPVRQSNILKHITRKGTKRNADDMTAPPTSDKGGEEDEEDDEEIPPECQ